MGKVFLAYASMSGNTEEIAGLIEQGLQIEGFDVEKHEIFDVTAKDLENFDAIILGSYTWGDGEIPAEFEDFYDELAAMDLTGKTFAVFGSGDTAYEIFCGAVDVIETMITEKGGTLALEGLKVELNPEGDDEDRCMQFGATFANRIKMVNS